MKSSSTFVSHICEKHEAIFSPTIMADENPQSTPVNTVPAVKNESVQTPTSTSTGDNNSAPTENQRDGRGVGRGNSRGNRSHRGGKGNDRGGRKKHDLGRNEWA